MQLIAFIFILIIKLAGLFISVAISMFFVVAELLINIIGNIMTFIIGKVKK